MGSILVRQAVVVPIAAMLVPILIAFTLPGYSSVSQHISETALLDHPIALIQRGAAFVTGVSIILFGLGLYLASTRRFGFTLAAAILFGASMVSNGAFVMGSPLHGLYGLGLFMALVPAFFAAEARDNAPSSVKTLSLAVALFSLGYLWLMLSGFDPEAYNGLTQRVSTIAIFGWYSIAAYTFRGDPKV